MPETIFISEQARQYAIEQLAYGDLLHYHNISTLNRLLESLQLLSVEEGFAQEETEAVFLALCFYFTGFAEAAAATTEDYFIQAEKITLEKLKNWWNGKQISSHEKTVALQVLGSLFSGKAATRIEKVASDALQSDWAREKGRIYFSDFMAELAGKTGLTYREIELEGLHWLYHHRYYTVYAKKNFEAGKILVIEKLEKDLKQAEHKTDIFLKQDLHLDAGELKQLKKKLKAIKERDERSFMDMLSTTSRNHYTLNQMVDRKARIIVWVNAFVLSFIINRMLEEPDLNDWRFYLLILPSITGLVSIFYAVLSIRPEKSHGRLSVEDIRKSKGNPLFFGNFQSLPPDVYENSMLDMVNNKEFVYRAMIQDIYFLGQILRQKRNDLQISLYVFVAGMTLTLIMTFLFRVSMG